MRHLLRSVYSGVPPRHVQQVHTNGSHTHSPAHAELPALFDQTSSADDLQKCLQSVDTDTLRGSPSLLLALTHKFVPLTERDPQLLGRIAALCLEAARATASASDVWQYLSRQLQRDDLPLPAARSLLACLEHFQENRPAGEATTEYIHAWAYMKTREEAQQQRLKQLSQQYSGPCAIRFGTAFPGPTQPSNSSKL